MCDDPCATSNLQAHKREMFDGMRAYHQSEISHTNNAVALLVAVIAAGGAGVLAILFPDTPTKNAALIAWGLATFVSVGSIAIAWVTHRKINSDHESYAVFGADYELMMEALKIKDMKIGESAKELKFQNGIGQGLGYKKTQNSLWTLALLASLSMLIFAWRVEQLVTPG